VVGKGQDVWELLVAYAKQETVEPLKGLGRWVAAGAGGSLLIATGLSLWLLALLRFLQTETGTTFTGNWSWAPYMIVLVGAGLVIAVSYWAIKTRRKGR
jgi:cytochrome b subunit of formate dehydrogenase